MRHGNLHLNSTMTAAVQIERLYISPGHNFFGHHGRPAGEHAMVECSEIECRAAQGVIGDRFYGWKPDYAGQITFFALEVYAAICRALQIYDRPLSVFRRNVITAGVDLNDLIGREFEVQGVRFRGSEECRPCYWMDRAFAPGAEKFLRGRGGLRAVILNNGCLRSAAVSQTSERQGSREPQQTVPGKNA